MTAVDRTSKLLEKLQQVEAISEDARQALRRERSDLAAHEEELLEQVQRPREASCFICLLCMPILFLPSCSCGCYKSTFHPRSGAAAACAVRSHVT